MEQEPLRGARKRGRDATERARKSVGAAVGQILPRKGVLAVRVDQESLELIDALVEADVVKSRSEAAQSLIKAGIEARSELFSKLAAEREETLRRKEELQQML